jgi:hypothetical protein
MQSDNLPVSLVNESPAQLCGKRFHIDFVDRQAKSGIDD